MLLAHKIALDPNAAQRLYFARAAGTARFAWNWTLAEWKRQYEAGEKQTWMALSRQLNAIKRDQFPWMYDVTKCAAQDAIIDLGIAFRAFFEKRGRYPRFKRRETAISAAAIGQSPPRLVQGAAACLRRRTIGPRQHRFVFGRTTRRNAPKDGMALPISLLRHVIGAFESARIGAK